MKAVLICQTLKSLGIPRSPWTTLWEPLLSIINWLAIFINKNEFTFTVTTRVGYAGINFAKSKQNFRDFYKEKFEIQRL
jgi:hypothetical protein